MPPFTMIVFTKHLSVEAGKFLGSRVHLAKRESVPAYENEGRSSSDLCTNIRIPRHWQGRSCRRLNVRCSARR